MSVILKTNALRFKDADGNVKTANMIGDTTTEELVAQVEALSEEVIDRAEAAVDQIDSQVDDIIDDATTAVSQAQTAVNTLESQKDAIAATVASMAELGTDTTLTTSGMAADAKTVGDKIDEQTSRIANSREWTNLPLVWNSGLFVRNNKYIVDEGFSLSDAIAVVDGTTIRYSHNQSNIYIECIAFSDGTKDSNNRYVISSGYTEESSSIIPSVITIKVPEGMRYVIISKTDRYETETSTVLEIKNASISDVINSISEELKSKGDKSDVDSVLEKTEKIERVPSNNIFDSDNHIIATGKWWNIYGSKVTLQENQYTSKYTALKIPVNQDEDITFSSGLTENKSKLYNYFTVKGDNIRIGDGIDVNQYLRFDNPITIHIPEECEFILVNITNFHYVIDSFMVNYGETALPYEKFTIYTYIEDLKSDVTNYLLEKTKDLVPNDVTLQLPNQFEVIVGDTFELFWKGVINCVDYNEFYVEAICDKGNNYRRRFIYTPIASDVGTHIMTVNLYDSNNTLLDMKTVNIVVKQKSDSPEEEKVVLCVGDSLTAGGHWPSEFNRRLTADDGTPVGDGLNNISFIGNQTGQNGVKYCGYGGWRYSHYNTEGKTGAFMQITCTSHDKTDSDQHSIYKDSNNIRWKIETIEENTIFIIRDSTSGNLPTTGGSLTWVSGGENHSNIVYTDAEQAPGNPFWDAENNKVSFSKFVISQNKTSLDYVYVLLGWNMEYYSEEDAKEDAQTFIENVHTDFPDCEIILLGLEYPSLDGCGYNYGASQMFYRFMKNVWKFNKINAELSSENEHVSFINIAGQFDSENNMVTSTRAVNNRNTKTEEYQKNGIHPATNGYYQIADACWRDFHHKLQA